MENNKDTRHHERFMPRGYRSSEPAEEERREEPVEIVEEIRVVKEPIIQKQEPVTEEESPSAESNGLAFAVIFMSAFACLSFFLPWLNVTMDSYYDSTSRQGNLLAIAGDEPFLSRLVYAYLALSLVMIILAACKVNFYKVLGFYLFLISSIGSAYFTYGLMSDGSMTDYYFNMQMSVGIGAWICVVCSIIGFIVVLVDIITDHKRHPWIWAAIGLVPVLLLIGAYLLTLSDLPLSVVFSDIEEILSFTLPMLYSVALVTLLIIYIYRKVSKKEYKTKTLMWVIIAMYAFFLLYIAVNTAFSTNEIKSLFDF